MDRWTMDVLGTALLEEEEMEWTVACKYCGKEFDSHDSYADSREMLRVHIIKTHD